MAVSKFLTSRLSSKIWYSSLLAGNQQFLGNRGAYDSIATAVGTGSNTEITFSSIPQNYTHLQVRYIGKRDSAVNTSSCSIRFNGDSGTNYTRHEFGGDGSAAYASSATSQVQMNINYLTGTTPTNTFGVGVVDILDYTSTNKNKTVRALTGVDTNGAGILNLASGLWLNTSAITSVTFVMGNAFTSGSQFALYGIKGR